MNNSFTSLLGQFILMLNKLDSLKSPVIPYSLIAAIRKDHVPAIQIFMEVCKRSCATDMFFSMLPCCVVVLYEQIDIRTE